MLSSDGQSILGTAKVLSNLVAVFIGSADYSAQKTRIDNAGVRGHREVFKEMGTWRRAQWRRPQPSRPPGCRAAR
jgi:hypothetical protein